MIKAPRLRSSKTPSRRAAASQPGVVANRLFPGLTALWFAALFGLGSLVASAEALGGLVVHLHLPAILPAAAPPLGLTARLVLGLAFAGLGGMFGLGIGLFLYAQAGGKLPARPLRAGYTPAPESEPALSKDRLQRVRPRDAHPDAPPRRPLVVTEDVLPYPTSMVAAQSAPAQFEEAPVEPTQAPTTGTDFVFGGDGESADLPPFLAAAMFAARNDEAPVFVAPAEPIIVPVGPVIEPVEIAPIQIAPVGAEAVEQPPIATEFVEPEPAVVAEVALPASPAPLASQAASAPKVPLIDLPLDSLGLVQLIERLAQAIATRQAHRAFAAAPEHAPAADAVDLRAPLHRFDPLSMDPTGPLLRAKKSRSDASDASDAGEDDEAGHATPGPLLHDPLAAISAWDDDQTDHALPARFLGGPVEAVATTDFQATQPHAGDDEADVNDRYSSLTDMTLPRPELVTPAHFAGREDDGQADPVVRFPSRPAAGDAAHPLPANEADRALREALATLRQMSAQR